MSPEGGYRIKTYYPTLEQMKDFSAYIKYIHDDGGNKAGLAKIVPPPEYKPRKAGYCDDKLYDMIIEHPIKQEVTGERGLYQQFNVEYKSQMSVRSFMRLAEEEHNTPVHQSPEELERIFWKNIFTNPSIYGADVPGTLYDDDIEEFNLTRLNTILDNISEDYGVAIPGVNTTYLYFGMWKTSFCWHTEDMDLYSINYLHFGAPKAWYSIPPEHGKRFERLAANFFPHNLKSCKAFLRHKTTLISPQVLKNHSIPFSKCIQEKGEFMITFPYSYHSGYNHGFNIAEATNFALEYWIEFGKWASKCECSSESVKISMQTFVKRYQADRYEKWIRGQDICKDPREPRHLAAAPKPSEFDLYIMGCEEVNYVVDEEDFNKKKNSVSKIKTKAARKAYPSIEETYQRYHELFPQHNNNNKSTPPPDVPHFSPIPNEMVPINPGEFRFYKTPTTLGDDFYEGIDLEKHRERLAVFNAERKAKGKTKKRKTEVKLEKKSKKRPKEPTIPSNSLLQFLPLTFTHEKRFNRCIAALPPHCAICQLMEPHPIDNENIWGPLNQSTSTLANESTTADTTHEDAAQPANVSTITAPITAGPQVEEFTLPSSGPILLPREIFRNFPKTLVGSPSDVKPQTTEDEDLKFLNLNLDSARLLRCIVCMLCVHTTCYGLDECYEPTGEWICDRCQEKNRSMIGCELCPCRGGALKAYKSHWIHIACGLAISGSNFGPLIEPTDKQVKSEDDTTCFYCDKSTGIAKYIEGKCIQCEGYWTDPLDEKSHVQCTKYFHPTCGHRNGAKFIEFDLHKDPDNHLPIRVICSDCQDKIKSTAANDDTESIQSDDTPDASTVQKGTDVIALADDGYYYDGVIDEVRIDSYLEVYFPKDAELEVNVLPEAVIGYDKSKEYKMGQEICVEWKIEGSDETEVRAGKYKGRYQTVDYKVRFRCTSLKPRHVRRADMFLNSEFMPADLLLKYRINY